MSKEFTESFDTKYLELLLDPLRTCAKYTPNFGKNESDEFTAIRFQEVYGADPLYHWIGLDSELMYAAHKAAGGMTSIYRQLGTGCERLFRAVIADTLKIAPDDLNWGYDVETDDGGSRRLTLDAKIDCTSIVDSRAKKRMASWLSTSAKSLGISQARSKEISGAVFEVRQGYKSADAKRQNADLRNAAHAFSENYLPVITVLSTQISDTLLRRYRNGNMLVLTGDRSGDVLKDTYAFMNNIVGFPLDSFFERNSEILRREVNLILAALLSPKAT